MRSASPPAAWIFSTTQSPARRTSAKRAGSGLTLGIAMNSASSLIVSAGTAAQCSSFVGMRLSLACVVCAVALSLAGGAAAVETFPITGASIAKAKLGWTQAHYRSVLGAPARVDRLEGGLVRLAYPKRKLEVYLHGGRGVAIATWNRRYTDGAGIGPCAPIVDAQQAYDAHWTKLLGGPDVQLWQYRTLTFRIGKGKVLAVVLATNPYRLQIAGNTSDC